MLNGLICFKRFGKMLKNVGIVLENVEKKMENVGNILDNFGKMLIKKHGKTCMLFNILENWLKHTKHVWTYKNNKKTIRNT